MSAKQAIHLGALAIAPEKVRIIGPAFGLPDLGQL